MAGSRDTAGGWHPQAAPVNIPLSNFTHGYTRRDAVVLHIIVGTVASAKSKFLNAASRTSSHFAISKTGALTQFVSVLDTAYANGLSWNGQYWVDPEGVVLKPPHAPTWTGLRPPLNPNSQTISIEHEGQPDDLPTLAMAATRAALLRWLGEQFPSFRIYVPHTNLIGHYEISPANRAHCPGPHVDYAQIAASGSQPSKVCRVLGATVYGDSLLTIPVTHLPAGAVVQSDAQSPQPGYAPGALHVYWDQGSGFMRADEVV